MVNRANQFVERSQPDLLVLVDERKIADEIVEDRGVQLIGKVKDRRCRDVAQERKALFEVGPAFLLVFHFGDDVLRLAEILLMKALNSRRTVNRDVLAVVTFDEQIFDVFNSSGFDLRDGKIYVCRKGHAKSFVRHGTRKALDAGFRICVLGAPRGKETSSLSMRTATLSRAPASESRIPFSPASNGRLGRSCRIPASFFRIELAVVICALGRLLPFRNERHCACAFASDLLQHGIVVTRPDSQIPGDDFALALFRQNAAEKSSVLPRGAR
jgi:hypothetical protein